MRKNIIALSLLCMIALSSCYFESDPIILDTSKEYSLYDYYEDELGNKGIVAYVEESSFIIVLSLDETEAAWGPMGEMVYDSSNFSAHIVTNCFGLAVLQNMKAKNIERFPAQAWCDRKNGTDTYPNVASWRLPSDFEMFLIYNNSQAAVNRLNYYIGRAGGDLIGKDKLYWTCMEDFDNYCFVVNQPPDFDAENRAIAKSPINRVYADKDLWIKKKVNYVRAIKYIYYCL